MAYKRISPQPVIEGGTGISAATPYAVLCGGTTSTGPLQNVSGVGSSGNVLISGGASALPSWGVGSSGSGWVLIDTQTVTNVLFVDFLSLTSLYDNYVVVLSNVSVTNPGGGKLILYLFPQGSPTIQAATVFGTQHVSTSSATWRLSSPFNSIAFTGTNTSTGIVDLSSTVYLMGLTSVNTLVFGPGGPIALGRSVYTDSFDGVTYQCIMGGRWNFASDPPVPFVGIRIRWTSGVDLIAGGTFSLYGISK